MKHLRRTSTAACLALVSALACSKSNDPAPSGGVAGDGWERIVEGQWTLGPGEETERGCAKTLLTEDIYVSAIRPVHPPGTHHTLLTLGDEKSECTGAISNGLLYAAALGSEGLTLPEGVAIKLPKGQYLNLGLHLYNTTDETISGTSGMEIRRMAAADVKYEAEAVLAGPFDIDIPPGRQTIEGDCTVAADQKVFAVFPHMHQLGVHFKTTLVVGGKEEVIHDADFAFDEQVQEILDPPIAMAAGDTVRSTCTYENPGATNVTFGESSDTEMCFSVLFRYPKQDRAICTSGGGGATTIDGPPCAEAGAVGNELGIGKQCSKDGGECGSNLCVADYVGGDWGNFCTRSCTADDQCGSGAVCQGSPGRTVCIPDACVRPTADGGATEAAAPDAG